MAGIEKAIFTNMCMIYDGRGNVLVQDRVDPDWSGITFPGGHVDAGESFTDSVIREVFEETGLTVSNLQMCGIKDWTNSDGSRYVVLCYKTDCFKGEPKSSDEGEVYWTSLKDLVNKNLVEGMESMLNLFVDDNITEYYFYKENGKWIEALK